MASYYLRWSLQWASGPSKVLEGWGLSPRLCVHLDWLGKQWNIVFLSKPLQLGMGSGQLFPGLGRWAKESSRSCIGPWGAEAQHFRLRPEDGKQGFLQSCAWRQRRTGASDTQWMSYQVLAFFLGRWVSVTVLQISRYLVDEQVVCYMQVQGWEYWWPKKVLLSVGCLDWLGLCE